MTVPTIENVLEPVDDPGTGFMCKTDFECELFWASGGSKVYATVEELVEKRPCVLTCGIVQVKVLAVKVLLDRYDGPGEPYNPEDDRRELVE